MPGLGRFGGIADSFPVAELVPRELGFGEPRRRRDRHVRPRPPLPGRSAGRYHGAVTSRGGET
jgi:hypothetical protein